MTVAEGGGKRAVMRKFQDVYLPALKANFIVWPLVQMLNFRVIPIQFQIVSKEIRAALIRNRLTFNSPSCRLWVSSGLRIFPSRTPQMNR